MQTYKFEITREPYIAPLNDYRDGQARRRDRRAAEIADGMRINHHNVHKSKKSYNRQTSKRINWD